jgi:hypothetical protein
MSDLDRQSASPYRQSLHQRSDKIPSPGGRIGGARRMLHNAFAVWRENGLATLAVRSASKLARICGHTFGIGAEGRRAWAAARREMLIRSIAAEAATAEKSFESLRGLTEIAHIVRGNCETCMHFEDSTCSLLKGRKMDASRKSFPQTLLDRRAACPIGLWPGRSSPPITRRNLVYFIFPLQHPERVWQWNVAELLKRISVFNGRRIVTVATVPGGSIGKGRIVDPPEVVVESFAGHDVEFRFVPNDARRQEAPHFLSAMREVASTDPSEAVFYGHAKGVTRPIEGGEAIRAWTAAMYHHNLDRFDEVSDLLRRWPCLGIAKSYGYPEIFAEGRACRTWGEGNRPWHGWHYAGTFWWVRHDALFSRPEWDQFEIFSYATEKYLANFFRAEEAFCLAYDNCTLPYELETWRNEWEESRDAANWLTDRQRKAA